MSAPQVLQDAKGHYYIDPTTGRTMRVVNGQWEPEAPEPAPAPVVPMAPVAPVAPVVAAPIAVAPSPVMPVAAAPVAAAPVMPTAAPVMPTASPIDALNAVMNQAPAAPGVTADITSFLGGDMSQVNDNTFAVIPDGTKVNWIISELELTESKNDGKPMMKLVLEVTDPEYKGKKIWDYIKLDESTRWKFKSLCRATGLLSPDEARFTGSSVYDFKGRRGACRVKVEQYNGTDSNKVSGSYEAFTDPAAPVMSAPVPGAPAWPQA